VRGDLLDVVLLCAVAVFGVSGYRQGFVVGVLSLVGFLGGGLLGARVAPELARVRPFDALPTALLGLLSVLVLALVGQLVATALGGRLRARLTWRPARLVDALAGAAVSVTGLLLVAWLVGTAVASSPYPALASQVRRSEVIARVDAVLPERARGSVEGLRRLVDEHGFPDVFGDLTPTSAAEVAPPDPALAGSAAVTSARPSVLKITGIATSCSRRLEGSGFVYAPERVMTNAHVVAGVDEPNVQVGDRRLPATVVVFDPERDLAVLRVPGLTAPALALAAPVPAGTGGVVVGYPNDGPFRADAARVREVQDARGPDIYGERTVVREVYALRAVVQPGNSGGPLLDAGGSVLGVVFAAAADRTDTGYALTAREAAPDAEAGRTATAAVSTRDCD
jgi:S1-C subfamily serine protease